jgi:hypothetical protein
MTAYAGKAWLVHGGDSRQMHSDVTVLPWHEINSERIYSDGSAKMRFLLASKGENKISPPSKPPTS